jgi:PKD repeat protein
MKRIFTLIIVFATIYNSFGQDPIFTAKEQSNSGVKDIVISEKTYKTLTNPNLNLRKLQKIASKLKEGQKVADDPYARINFELNRLKDPKTGMLPLNYRDLELKYVLSSSSGLRNKLKAGGLSFTHSGPRNVGGRTRALAIDLSDPTGNTILAGGVSGGLWKSTNNGVTWRRVTKPDDHPSITAIVQDPTNTNIWYYTTGELIGNSARGAGAPYRGNGLFKSEDNGENWTPVEATASDTPTILDSFDYCWNICIDPNNGDVYLATFDAIYIKKSGSQIWTKEIETFNNPSNYSRYNDIICTPVGVKYATISSLGDKNEGVWRKGSASDAVWENITPSNFPENYRRFVLAHAPSNTEKDIIYLLGDTPDFGLDGHSFWKLTYDSNSSSPASWENRSMNLPKNGGGDRDVDGYNSQGSYNMIVKVAPDDENMVFIGGINLHRSDDAFATNANPVNTGTDNGNSKTYWIGGYATENDVSTYPNHHPDVHSLVFKNNTTLICGHDGGLSITTNFKKKNDTSSSDNTSTPVDWTFLNNSYLTTQSYTMAIDEETKGSKLLISGFQDNGTWLAEDITPSTDWFQIGSGDGSYCAIFNNGNSILYSSQNGITSLLNNIYDEETFYRTRIDPEGATEQLFVNPYIVDANNSKIVYYAAGQYVWRNSNIFEIPKMSITEAEKNWEKLELSQVNGTVTALASSMFPAHVLYYGSSNGKVYKIENSHSESPKRTEITGTNFPEAYISSISINPLNADEVMLSFSNYGVESIFYTKDGGSNWVAVSGNLEDGSDSGNGPSVRSVAIMVSPTDTTYYAGTSTGLYSTSDLSVAKVTWTQEATNRIGTTVSDMVKVRRDGFIAVATHGNGVFTADADYSSVEPKALIGIEKNHLPVRDSTNFFSRSIGDGINSWEWIFEGGEPSSSTDEHPTNIKYNQKGTYSVSLTIKNSVGEDTQTIATAITVNDQIVGVDDKISQNKTDKLLIYPNPMEDKSKVEFPNEKNQKYRLIVVDASGRVVRIIDNITGDNFIINREQLKPGVHIINLTGEKIYKGKLLVK